MKRIIITLLTAAMVMSGAAVYAAEGIAAPEKAAPGMRVEPKEPEKLEEPEKAEKPESTAKPEEATKPEKPEAPEVTARPEKPEAPEVTARPEKPEAPEVTARPEKPEAPEVTARPEKPEAPEVTARPEKPEMPKITAKPEKPEDDKERKEEADDKSDNQSGLERLRELKGFIKDAKGDAKTYLKEMRGMFSDIGKENRKELLSEIATVKGTLKDSTIDTFVNGIHLDFEKYDNVLPVIENGRTLVPIRAIAEALGAEVSWDGNTRQITIKKGDIVIKMTIDGTTAYVNGKEKSLDAAPEIRDERALVPARFIAESLGLTVDWDEASKSVIIDE